MKNEIPIGIQYTTDKGFPYTAAGSTMLPSDVKDLERIADKWTKKYELAGLPNGMSLYPLIPLREAMLKALTEYYTSLIQRNEELEKWKVNEQQFLIKLATRLMISGQTNDNMIESVENLITQRDTLLSLVDKAETLITRHPAHTKDCAMMPLVKIGDSSHREYHENIKCTCGIETFLSEIQSYRDSQKQATEIQQYKS